MKSFKGTESTLAVLFSIKSPKKGVEIERGRGGAGFLFVDVRGGI
jgi:hypothetical protein